MSRTPERADYDAIWDELAPVAVAEFNERGEIPPRLFVIELREKPGDIDKLVVVDEALISAFFRNERMKDMFALLLHSLFQPSVIRDALEQQGIAVDVVVQVNEAWVTRSSGKTWKEAAAEHEKYGSVQNTPGRGEAIMLMMHTPKSSIAGFCSIMENPRRAEMGRWNADVQITGRMSMTHEGSMQ